MHTILFNAGLLLGAMLCMILSYHFEVQAYEAVAPGMALLTIPLPIVMAFTFNYCKFGLIWIIARSRLRGALISRAVKLLAILLSLIATLIVATQAAHEPNLEKELEARRYRAEAEYRERGQELKAKSTVEESASAQRYAQLRTEAQAYHQQAVLDYEAKRNKEMDNRGRRGNFNGDRYKEYSRLLEESRTAFQAELNRLREEERGEKQAIQDRLGEERKSLAAKRETDLGHLNREDLHGVEAVQNLKLLPLLQLINEVSGTRLTPVHLALVIALLITSIVEFAPISLVTYVARQEEDDRPAAQPHPLPASEEREETSGGEAKVRPLRLNH
ncbi:MAG: hypothetical protein KJ558_08020 [Gammaproteobacteria bacterium]|nr:hypothetical protein [Gammaproteobacteria bacterium]MBU1654760.1 hypothetical protein [Gammaproteobacteria bacterium]MBU1961635.1 hypothetical protein [Gammaproteobacteria bacterium]